jgi:hypothetical protein
MAFYPQELVTTDLSMNVARYGIYSFGATVDEILFIHNQNVKTLRKTSFKKILKDSDTPKLCRYARPIRAVHGALDYYIGINDCFKVQALLVVKEQLQTKVHKYCMFGIFDPPRDECISALLQAAHKQRFARRVIYEFDITKHMANFAVFASQSPYEHWRRRRTLQTESESAGVFDSDFEVFAACLNSNFPNFHLNTNN